MATVNDVCEFLNRFAPLNLAETWDNVGLLVGRRAASVRKIMTCLTLTPDVAEEAVENGVSLIVSHHPVLFRGAKQVSDDSVEGETLLRLIESGVAVYSPHTAFDSAQQGINQQIAESAGLLEIKPLKFFDEDAGTGCGRWGRLHSPVLISDFLCRLATILRTERLEFVASEHASVECVGIGCGAAEGFLRDAIHYGCDTFITGEARFHTILEARSRGVNLILTGHYFSERPAVETLAEKLQAVFPGVEVCASIRECNPLSLWQVDGDSDE